MSKHANLKNFTERMERDYPHVAEIGALRDEADQITDWIVANLKEVRRSAKKRQDEVAAALGVSQATISRYESGQEDVSLRDFVLFALACDQRPAFVLVPETESIQNERNSQNVVETIVEQLYPGLDLDLFNPQAATVQAAGAQEQAQVAVAARTVSFGLANLGIALHNLNLADEEA